MNVSNKKLLHAAKCQDYNFYRFSVIKEKPILMVKLYPTQIRVNGLMTTTVLNTKVKDNEKKYLILKFLATKATLIIKAAAVESKITDITNLATKAALNTKAKEIENKILDTTNVITTPEFNRLTKISFDSKMREAAFCK